jgi:hypothetical protein
LQKKNKKKRNKKSGFKKIPEKIGFSGLGSGLVPEKIGFSGSGFGWVIVPEPETQFYLGAIVCC